MSQSILKWYDILVCPCKSKCLESQLQITANLSMPYKWRNTEENTSATWDRNVQRSYFSSFIIRQQEQTSSKTGDW